MQVTILKHFFNTFHFAHCFQAHLASHWGFFRSLCNNTIFETIFHSSGLIGSYKITGWQPFRVTSLTVSPTSKACKWESKNDHAACVNRKCIYGSIFIVKASWESWNAISRSMHLCSVGRYGSGQLQKHQKAEAGAISSSYYISDMTNR